jgi:hypothetical protein
MSTMQFQPLSDKRPWHTIPPQTHLPATAMCGSTLQSRIRRGRDREPITIQAYLHAVTHEDHSQSARVVMTYSMQRYNGIHVFYVLTSLALPYIRQIILRGRRAFSGIRLCNGQRVQTSILYVGPFNGLPALKSTKKVQAATCHGDPCYF